MSANPRPQPRGNYLDDYEFVSTRVDKFHETYNEGRIVTSYELLNEMVIFHAKIYRHADDAEPAATGTAIDRIDIQKSTFEKVETASVGRALAFLNFKTKKGLASREEMEKMSNAQTVKPAPVATPKPPQSIVDRIDEHHEAQQESERNWHEEIVDLWKRLRALGHAQFKTPDAMMEHFKDYAKGKQWADRLQDIEKVTDMPLPTARVYVGILTDIYTATKEGVSR